MIKWLLRQMQRLTRDMECVAKSNRAISHDASATAATLDALSENLNRLLRTTSALTKTNEALANEVTALKSGLGAVESYAQRIEDIAENALTHQRDSAELCEEVTLLAGLLKERRPTNHYEWEPPTQPDKLSTLRAHSPFIPIDADRLLASLRSAERSLSMLAKKFANSGCGLTEATKSFRRDAELIVWKAQKATVKDLRFQVASDNSASMRLHRLLSPRASSPLLSSWSLELSVVERIVDLILIRRPKLFLECGSGASTVWLGYAMEIVGGKLIALEHLSEYSKKAEDDVERHGLNQSVEVRHAPLSSSSQVDGPMWYTVAALEDLSGIDMILVDGPPGGTSQHARYPVLGAVEARAAETGVLILDDIHRDEEQEIMARWCNEGYQLGHPWCLSSRALAAEWVGGLAPSRLLK